MVMEKLLEHLKLHKMKGQNNMFRIWKRLSVISSNDKIILMILLLPLVSFAQPTNDISIDGKSVSLEKRKDNVGNIVYRVNLVVRVKNSGATPVIIYPGNPHVDNMAIAISKPKALAGDFIYDKSAGLGKSYDFKLHRRMDKSSPPLSMFVILASNKTTEIRLQTFFYWSRNEPVSQNANGDINLINPLWAKIKVKTWPNKVELDGLGNENPFGEKLRERWRKYGYLWLDDIESEPIELKVGDLIKH